MSSVLTWTVKALTSGVTPVALKSRVSATMTASKLVKS